MSEEIPHFLIIKGSSDSSGNVQRDDIVCRRREKVSTATRHLINELSPRTHPADLPRIINSFTRNFTFAFVSSSGKLFLLESPHLSLHSII